MILFMDGVLILKLFIVYRCVLSSFFCCVLLDFEIVVFNVFFNFFYVFILNDMFIKYYLVFLFGFNVDLDLIL